MHARETCATLRVVPSYGQCKASLRNGQRCRIVIETREQSSGRITSGSPRSTGLTLVRRGGCAEEAGGAIDPANVAILAPLAAVPDLLAQVAAIELFLHEALGRSPAERVTGS
jgi:hypothetical protein